MGVQRNISFLGMVLICVAVGGAQEKTFAPLADKITAAKTVFLVNTTGTAKFGDALYRQVKNWNRWQVVTDKGKADLLLVLSQQDTVGGVISTLSSSAAGQTATGTGVAVPITTERWYLHVVDAKTGEKLWTAEATMGGKWRSWGSIAKSLLSDIQKRLH